MSSTMAPGKAKIHLLFLSFQKGTLAAPKLDGTRENANSFAFPLVLKRHFGCAEVALHSGKCKFICFSSRFCVTLQKMKKL